MKARIPRIDGSAHAVNGRSGALMTIPEVQGELRCGLTMVYRCINDRRLEKVKLGAATRITRESFDRLIADLRANVAGGEQ